MTSRCSPFQMLVSRTTVVLLAAVASAALAVSSVHAQSFTVPGNNRGWFDTGIDVPPGTLITLSASGRVDVGAGWGSHGPEGTTRFADVPGYPAATLHRYGLVARLTESRTNGNDELHNDYSYAQFRQFCSGGGGHLWFAVNDDRPENNQGGFNVNVTRGTCARVPTSAPAALPARRATFTVTLNGFRVHRQTWDDALNSDGAGDEVYFFWNSTMVDLSGASPEPQTWNAFTSTFGDAGHRNRIQAGNASTNGGLRDGDSFPAVAPERGGSGQTGLAIFRGELIEGQTGGVLVPTIFETDLGGDLRPRFMRAMNDARPALESRITELVRGPAVRARELIVRGGDGLGLSGLRSVISHGASFTGESGDRPLGMTRRIGQGGFTFVPQGLVLTYASAEAIVGSDLFGKGRGIVEVRYTDDDRLKGDYSLYFQVERVTP